MAHGKQSLPLFVGLNIAWLSYGASCLELDRKSLFYGKLERPVSIATGVAARLLRRSQAPFSAKFAATRLQKCPSEATSNRKWHPMTATLY
jgi:hypothetical protein